MNLALGCVAENTPKYLGQAVRLVQSVRWFGGCLNEAKLYVCVVDNIRQDFREELERYGATITIVPRFSAKHPQSNKLRFLELSDLAIHDRVLLLDCDTIVVRDPTSGLFQADFSAKTADVPTVPLDTFRRIFSAFGLSIPAIDQRCTVRDEPTIPYFNAGVLAFSRRGMDILVPKWIELNRQLIARMELLGEHSNFCEQASLSLALAATDIHFEVVGNAFNFPMHFDDPATAPNLADTDPCIIHYHSLADPSGYIIPSVYPAVNNRITEFNARLRRERESRFDNQFFWNQRYMENPELGSGVGSRGKVRDYKRQLLAKVVSQWAPITILDVGCGDLEVGSALPVDGYIGLDLSEVAVANNRKQFPDRTFVACNFLDLKHSRADMVVCLDVLIHLASPDEYQKFVRNLVRSAIKVGIVAGEETDSGLTGIVFFHEPVSHTLAKAGARNVRKIGSYRHLTIFEFMPPMSDSAEQAMLSNDSFISEGSVHPSEISQQITNSILQNNVPRSNPSGQEARPLTNNKAIIVLGMHRSGTSAMAGVLHILGAEAGSSLLPAQKDVNPKGFWEQADVVDLHNQLLQSLGSGWYDERPFPVGWLETPVTREIQRKLAEIVRNEFYGVGLWVVKDPRLCRVLPLWEKLLADLGVSPFYLLVLRDPVEVAASLARRDGFVAEKSYLLWLSYVLESERGTRNQKRFVISYEALLVDWQIALAPLVETYELPLALNDAVAVARVNAFLESTLRHHVKSIDSENSAQPLRRVAQDAYKAILANDSVRLNQLEEMKLQEIGHCMPWLNQINELIGYLEACEAKLTECNSAISGLKHEVARIKKSVSWRITGPLRVIGNLMRKMSNQGPPNRM